jgi:hypothetical protein
MIRRLLIAGGGSSFTPTEDGVFHGAKAYNSAYVAWADQEARPVDLDTTEFDTDGYHFTSAANLTGTVAKASGSPNITGSSTLFTSELTVNQVISIPGTATEIGVVQTITDNTHLVLWANMANTASGQTAKRRNEYMAVPAGMAGYYRLDCGTFIGRTMSQDAPFTLGTNAASIIGASTTGYYAQPNDVGGTSQTTGIAYLNEGDFIWAQLYIDNNFVSKTFYVGGDPGFAPPWQRGLATWMAIERVGT